jgi:hypothetical protein
MAAMNETNCPICNQPLECTSESDPVRPDTESCILNCPSHHYTVVSKQLMTLYRIGRQRLIIDWGDDEKKKDTVRKCI